MLTQQTITRLRDMRLEAMASEYERQQSLTDTLTMSFEDRFAMLVDKLWLTKENQALERRLKTARLKITAAIEDIDWRHRRGLDRSVIDSLATSEWGLFRIFCNF